MRNFKATKVVAVDPAGVAITKRADQWTAKYNEKKNTLLLSCGGHRRRYDLTTGVRFLAIVDKKDEVDLGRTLGRMALTGIATNGFVHGKGVPGAVMDLAMRGVATNAWLRCEMVLTDLSVVSFEARPEELKAAPALVRAASDAARERLEALNDLFRRVLADGERVLPELDASIAEQRKEAARLAQDAETGAGFAERDNARQKLDEVKAELADRETVREAMIVDLAMSRLGPLHGLLGRVGKVLMWIIIALVAVSAFIIYAVSTPAGDTAKSKTVPQAQQRQESRPLISPSTMTPPASIIVPAAAALAPQSPLVATAPPTSASPAVSRPSFDCVKASTRLEKMICSNPDLGDADREMAAIYRQALQAASDPEQLKKSQVAWRRDKRDNCSSAPCVLDAYETRSRALRASQ